MKTIGFFNNKGGVGKTTLVYHLAWMMSELGVGTIAADLDPQSNLTAMMIEETELEELWSQDPKATIHGAVAPQFRGVGDIIPPRVRRIDDHMGLLVGDLELSRLEDQLSQAWPQCANGDERSFRVMSTFSRTLARAASDYQADVVLVDVGPNLGALNRAVLLGCDHIVVPLAADLFSLQGLRNMGPALRTWHADWQRSLGRNPDPALALPQGHMAPAGYVMMRHAVRDGQPTQAFGRWAERIPAAYHQYVLDGSSALDVAAASDPECLAELRDYRSLMPMAQIARKPMFALKPADGAFGGHQGRVQDCRADFARLARRILAACGIAKPT